MPASSAQGSQNPQSLWGRAMGLLTDDERRRVSFGAESRLDISGALAAAENKKEECLEKRWKYRKGYKTIILRDVFEKIVKWISTFKEVGDAVAQYDASYAAPPWAGVRSLLQITISDTEMFGAMAEGLELVSNVITRYAVFEALYLQTTSPSRDQLSQSTVGLYAAVLKYLSNARHYYDKNATQGFTMGSEQAAGEIVEACIRRITEEKAVVDACARLVDTECDRHGIANGVHDLRNSLDLLSAENRQKLERILSELDKPINRPTVQTSDIRDSLKESEQENILQWISTIPYKAHHKAMVKDCIPGLGEWLLSKEKFTEWRKSSVSSILWLRGPSGSGKTRLVSSVIECLAGQSHATPGSAPISYFYCAQDAAELRRSDPTEILRSILKQLSYKLDLPIVEAYRRKEKSALTECEIKKLTLTESVELILALTERNPATIIIDALDECNPTRRRELLAALDEIIQGSASLVKVFASSRDGSVGDCLLMNSPNEYIHTSGNGQDVERFIHLEVAKCIKDRRILGGKVSEELLNQIITTLTKKSQGMFRWVSLQIQNLCDPRRMKVEEEIQRELRSHPKTLSDLHALVYERIARSGPTRSSIANRALKWLLCAERPLSTREFNAAVSIDSRGEYVALCTADLPDICCNLVVLDAELDVFRFAHPSVREYLESREEYSPVKAHMVAAERCINRFIAKLDPTQISKPAVGQNKILDPYATLYWPVHLREVQSYHLAGRLKEKVRRFLFLNGSVTPVFADWVFAAPRVQTSLDWHDPLRIALKTISSPSSTPLFPACSLGLLCIIDDLSTSGGFDWNQRNYQGDAGLHVAAENGHAEVVQRLITKGADLEAKDLGDMTPLSRAAMEGHTGVVQRLLAEGADLETKDKSGWTPLSWAAVSGNAGVAELLVAKGADLETRGAGGQTPLSLAAEEGHAKIVQQLLTKGADLEAENKYGQSPLLLAAGAGHAEAVKQLLAEGADLETRDECGRAPLSMAAKGGHVQVMQQLLARDADVETKGGGGRTPLLWAVESGQARAVNLLLAGGAGLEATDEDGCGWTPLSLAAAAGHAEIVQRLLAEGADLEAENEDGQSPLSLAAERGHPKVVQRLLAKGADLETKDESGWGPLSLAAGSGHTEVVKQLIAAGASLDTSDDDGQTPLSRAAMEGRTEVVQQLLVKGANPETKDSFGQTPLSLAAEGGHVKVVEQLLATGADLGTEDLFGQTPLSLATDEGYAGVVQQLIAKGANLEAKGKDGQSPLSRAAKAGCNEVVRLLLTKGTDLETKDSFGQTPLSLASEAGHPKVVQQLLSKDADINTKDEDGSTPLSRAAREGHSRVVQQLLAKGASLETEDSFSQTPLSLAAEEGHVKVVQQLIAKGAKLETKDDFGQTPLSLAAEEGHAMVVEQLIAKGAILDTKDEGGQAPLSWAAKEGNTEVVQQLLAKGADFDTVDSEGRTPLSLAAEEGFAGIVQQLIAKGANLETKDSFGQSPLSLAAEGGHANVVKELVAKGTGLEVKNQNGQTPLSLAAERLHTDVVQLLLAGGADPETRDVHGRTPLIWAALNGHTEIVQLLLANGASPETQDADGRTPLSWAALNGRAEVAQQLLAEGADPESEDSSGRTPRMWASFGHLNVEL